MNYIIIMRKKRINIQIYSLIIIIKELKLMTIMIWKKIKLIKYLEVK